MSVPFNPTAPQAAFNPYDPAAAGAAAPQAAAPQFPQPAMFGSDTVQFGSEEKADDAADKGSNVVSRLTDAVKAHFEGVGKNPFKLALKLVTFAIKLPVILLAALKGPKEDGGDEGGDNPPAAPAEPTDS